jgi:hypothetical protein
MPSNGQMQPRFKPRHAVVGYVIALVFAFNGLAAVISDTSFAAGGSAFARITCLGGERPAQLPGQPDHAVTCSCTLSCCCAGSLARNANATKIGYPVADATGPRSMPGSLLRDVRTDRPLHLRSPPPRAP